MAVFDSILVPSEQAGTQFSVTSLSSSAEQAFGPNVILAINADQDLTISFGVAGAVPTATSAFFRIPANNNFVFMTSRNWPSFKVFNLSGTTTAKVYIQPFNQF